MCFLAPASLIYRNIEWKVVDDIKVDAKFTNCNIKSYG